MSDIRALVREVFQAKIREQKTHGRYGPKNDDFADAVAVAVLKAVRAEAHGAQDFIDGERVDELIAQFSAFPVVGTPDPMTDASTRERIYVVAQTAEDAHTDPVAKTVAGAHAAAREALLISADALTKAGYGDAIHVLNPLLTDLSDADAQTPAQLSYPGRAPVIDSEGTGHDE